MARLLDYGLSTMSNLMMDMAELSVRSVDAAIELYEKGNGDKSRIFGWSEQLRMLQEEVTEIAVDLIARYQPVATDLRFIHSCIEISYGFYRFGRYAYDIADVIGTMGSVSHCEKGAVLEMADTTRTMIYTSVQALKSRDSEAAQKLYQMDDTVDALYRRHLREAITPSTKKGSNDLILDPRCYVSSLLILRYLERMADHACCIGDSVYYIVVGVPCPRR
jgi:phosphate transport system protein